MQNVSMRQKHNINYKRSREKKSKQKARIM